MKSTDCRAFPLVRPLQRKSCEQIIHLHLSRLTPVEDHLDDLRREQGQPKDPANIGCVHALRPGQILQRRMRTLVQHPAPPERPGQRLTMALSTRGRGAHIAPSGVTTSFRPPRSGT